MKRREFLASSIAATTAAAAAGSAWANQAAESPPPGSPEYYELRLYQLRRGPMQSRFDQHCREVALPAWNGAGVARVGVFDVVVGPDNPTKYVLLPFPSLAMLERARLEVARNRAVQDSAFANAAPTDPPYVRVESSLLVAFRSIPKLEAPERNLRLFELRIYESHSKRANRKKIEMFDEGEIAIFRRTGLRPVFFGETLFGSKLPNLTYMLAFENMAERERNWAAFAGDPEWKKLSATPGYTDPEIVTNISSAFLRPTPYSQL